MTQDGLENLVRMIVAQVTAESIGDSSRRFGDLNARVLKLEEGISEVSSNVNKLVEIANMGKGAWWLMLRIGSLLLVLGAVIAWVLDKIHLHFG